MSRASAGSRRRSLVSTVARNAEVDFGKLIRNPFGDGPLLI